MFITNHSTVVRAEIHMGWKEVHGSWETYCSFWYCITMSATSSLLFSALTFSRKFVDTRQKAFHACLASCTCKYVEHVSGWTGHLWKALKSEYPQILPLLFALLSRGNVSCRYRKASEALSMAFTKFFIRHIGLVWCEGVVAGFCRPQQNWVLDILLSNFYILSASPFLPQVVQFPYSAVPFRYM